MKNKKILIFSTAYFPHVGGAEVAVKEITDRIFNFNFDMITVRLDKKDGQQEKIGNVNIYRLGWGLGKADKLLFPFRAACLAKKLHQKNKYDAIWSIMASFSGFSALFFKKNHPDVKFLLTLQEGDDLNEVEKKVNFPIIKKWFLEIFQKADYIQCISNYLADWAKTKNVKCPVEVVPNGVDLKRFTNIDIGLNREGSRQQLGIKSEDVVLISTSRLVPKNGLEDLIDATKFLVDKGYNVKTIILGDGPLKNKLKQRIIKYQPEGAMIEMSRIGKAQHIVLFGSESQKYIPGRLDMADIFVRPSLSEGLGISFLEAMVRGLPVVATPVGGIPDFLKDGETGWFCKVRDPQSIAEKVEYILDEKNSQEVKRVVENARQMVEEKYDWDKIAKQMKEVFIKLR